MPFKTARCSLCDFWIFKVEDVVAFEMRLKGLGSRKALAPVDLDGREPWSGVRCVCVACASTIAFSLHVAQRQDGVDNADHPGTSTSRSSTPSP
jgi:hypothetical protein